MTVVTAGVHHARVGGAVRFAADLFDGQRVHVGAQQRDGAGLFSAKRRQDSGLSNPGANTREACVAELAFDKGGRLELHEREFRALVKVATVRNELVDRCGRLIERWDQSV